MKWIIRQLGDIWCMFVHGFILDKHEMHIVYGPFECKICGRKWEL